MKDLPSKIQRILHDSKSVLDVGCGSGWLTGYITTSDYVGISYRFSEIDNLGKNGFSGLLLDLEKNDLPFPDGRFDCVYMGHIVEHFEKKELIRIMREVHRVLKAGGYIILVAPTEHSQIWAEWTHVKPYNHGSLPKMLEFFGFSDVDWCYPGISDLPRKAQAWLRYPFFFLRFLLWDEVCAWGRK